jgi:hypothetical protein
MLTTSSINAKTWKQPPLWACLILSTLYFYYTPGLGDGANVRSRILIPVSPGWSSKKKYSGYIIMALETISSHYHKCLLKLKV